MTLETTSLGTLTIICAMHVEGLGGIPGWQLAIKAVRIAGSPIPSPIKVNHWNNPTQSASLLKW